MPKLTNNDTLNALFAQVVSDNPDLRARLEQLTNQLLAEVERTLRYGDKKERAVYARMIVPGLLRGMHESRADSASQAQREAFDRVMAAVNGADGPDPPARKR